MSIFKKVKCLYYTNENNSINTKEYECTVVLQSGTISFGIYEVGLQIFISNKTIKNVLLKNKKSENECAYINFNDKNIILVNCKIKLTVESNLVQFQLLKQKNYFEIKSEDLKNILFIE